MTAAAAQEVAVATAATAAPVLDVRNVSKRFGGVKAVDGVSLQVMPGEIVSLIGPNGAGKTTTFNLISGVLPPSSGQIVFQGQDTAGLEQFDYARAGIGRTFQNLALFRHGTVVENLLIGRHIHFRYSVLESLLFWGRPRREETAAREKVERIIEFLEIEELRDKPVAQLAYGQQKRVELGRALACEPKLLLLDEIVAGMNREEKEDIARFTLDIRDELGVTVLMIEHDMQVVMDLSDRIYVLDFGSLIAEGTPAEVAADPKVLAAYLGEEAAVLEHDRLLRGEATLPGMLRHRAKERGDKVALREKIQGVWRASTWADYDRHARRVALGLTKLGLRRGDRIVIASEDTPQWFHADLGAQMIGVQVVGIYPTNPWSEVQYIAAHCQAKVAITGDQEQTDKVLEAMAGGAGLPHLRHVFCVDMKGLRRYPTGRPASFDDLLAMGAASAAEDPQAEARLDQSIDGLVPDDVNILVYTSGTTGPPKGAMLTHRNFVYGAYAYAAAREMLDKPFESVCYLPLCHVAERTYSTVLHLLTGGTVNFAESIDTVATNVREIAPRFFLGVPRIWEKLQQGFEFRMKDSGRAQQWLYRTGMRRGRLLSDRRAVQGRLTRLADRMQYALWYAVLFRNMQRHMGLNRSHTRMCGGASVSPETLRFFDIIGLPVGQGYGLTEAGGLAFVQVPGRPSVAGSCGPAMPGVEWRLGDDQEIFIRSPGVFKGYLFDDKGTADVLADDGWLASGDIVEVREGGEVAVVDRKKAIIITSGGKNIAPSELENALKDSPFIREAIVVGEGRKFLGGLIQIDFDSVGRWAAQRDIQYTTFKSLTRLPEVRELVQGVMDDVNSRFARVENIRKFVLLEKELDHDDGELTATQKVRRGLIDKKFARELEQIYGAG